VLRSGARWKDLPDGYPSYQTCHRRFQEWQTRGTFERIAFTLGEELLARGRLDLRESAIDGTFSSAKKGARSSAKRSAGRAPRS
jgi:transposase